jgi:hypothetical protein
MGKKDLAIILHTLVASPTDPAEQVAEVFIDDTQIY